MLDFHNHLIPGVDDGARDLEESRFAISTMKGQGVDTIVTTPHVRASILGGAEGAEYLTRVDAAWSKLNSLVDTEFSELRMERGCEVLIDTPQIDLSDPRVRLAGTPFVLVEFRLTNVPVNSSRAIVGIAMNGFIPVVAHPERYKQMDTRLELADEWRSAGAFLQVNEGSLVGQYGESARSLAWQLLERGLASYLSSDYHARGKCPTSAAKLALAKRGVHDEVVHLLTVVNPRNILSAQEPESVPRIKPLSKSSFWRRISGRG